ncbi:MAG TPA: hypothetical protein VE338_20835 [Ktedonobacterales bacterium]|jgi:hypothetical protein|nr:hypothetical protein [Ktedonobacterales bacterium]
MGNDDTHNDWDNFDFTKWGISPDAGESAPDGHAPAPSEQDGHYGDGFLRPALADVDEDVRTHGAGGWVSQGGVLRWQGNERDESDEDGTATPLREEAESLWAADEVDLPLGAPATARLRAVRAWLARRRLREAELIGALLLERRRLTAQAHASDDESDDDRETPSENPNDPLALALAEAQAAADEYESLLGLLEDTRAHVGPQAALVEYYLIITDRLATLAAQPAAPADFAEKTLFAQVERLPASGALTPAERTEWEGRAGAVLATRQRVEQVTAAEPEDD